LTIYRNSKKSEVHQRYQLRRILQKIPKVPTIISTVVRVKSVGNYKTQFGLIKFLEDTTSLLEDTASIPSYSVFGRRYSTVEKREVATSCPLDNSVDCFETNVTVMPQISGDAVQ
jgi:hypothetical protein